MSPDGDAHAVKFVEPNILNRPGFSVGENDGFPDELRLHVPECVEDGRRAALHSRHGVPRSQFGELLSGAVLHLKGVQVVTGARQPNVGKNPSKSSIIRWPIQARPGEPTSIGMKMRGNEIIRTSASADIDPRSSSTYQITVGIEHIQKARLIGPGIRLDSFQCVFVYEK
jgi:hypothetical protein